MDNTLTLRYLESVAVRPIGLLAVTAAVMILLRVKGAAARHAMWTLVTAGMLLIAVTQPVMPRVALRVLEPAPASRTMPGLRSADTLASQLSPVATVERAFPWETLLAGIWAAGAMLMLGRLAYGYGFTLRMVRAAREVEPGVWESDWIAVPVTVASRIVFPAEWREWSAEKREAVLAHERAHVRRHDWSIAVMAAVNRALFWFHPLAWWLERQLASLAEEACDDAALAEVGSREAYAQTLVEIAAAVTRSGGRVVWEAMAMARVAEVRTRVGRILDDARPLSRGVSWKRWIVMAGCALPAVWLASVVHLARVEAATVVDAPVAIEQEQDVAGRAARIKASQERLRELEAEIARSKRDNMGRLPEQFRANIAQLESVQMQVGNLNETLNQLQQQKMELETQLQNVTTRLHYGQASNTRLAGLYQRLEDLRRSHAAAQELYTPSHPQIKKMQAGIAAMEKEMETAQQELSENRTRQEQDLQTSVNLLKTQIDEKFQEMQALNHVYADLLRHHQRAKDELTDPSTGPSLLSRTDPEPAGIQGKVELAVTIGTDGVARDMQVVHSPDPALNKKAIECVAKWRFRPAMCEGQAVTAFASVEVNFR